MPVGCRVARGGECSVSRGILVLPPYAVKATRATATPAPAATAKRRIPVLKLRSPAFSKLPFKVPPRRRQPAVSRRAFRQRARTAKAHFERRCGSTDDRAARNRGHGRP